MAVAAARVPLTPSLPSSPLTSARSHRRLPFPSTLPFLARRSPANTSLRVPRSSTRVTDPTVVEMEDASSSRKPPVAAKKLKAIEATPASFAEFGQVVSASPDGDEFGPQDAQLELHRGTPRFYIMHLKDRELNFSNITHHASVTQCLGSVGGNVWYLGVSKASILNGEEMVSSTRMAGKKVVKSRCGHYYVPPHPDDVHVFRISGPKFLKLNTGTWHAGPLFKVESMDFYNLELSNTNVVDHTTHDFSSEDGVVFIVED